MSSPVEETQNGNSNGDPHENCGGTESGEMEVDSITANENTDVMSPQEEILSRTESDSPALQVHMNDSLQLQQKSDVCLEKSPAKLISPQEDETSAMLVTAESESQLSVKVTTKAFMDGRSDYAVPTEDMETLPKGKDTSQNQVQIDCLDSFRNVTESAHMSPEKSTVRPSDIGCSTPLLSEDSTFKPEANTPKDISDDGTSQSSIVMDCLDFLKNSVESAHASPEKPTAIRYSTPLHSKNDIFNPEVNTLKDTSDDDASIIELSNGADKEHNFSGSHRGAMVPYSDTEDSGSSSSSSGSDSSDDSDSESDNSNSGDLMKSHSDKEKQSSIPKPIKIHGELDLNDLPPIQDLHISVRNDQVVEIGKVLHTVDTLVVVECYKDQPPLDIDSVLFLDRGARPLGRIFDVMGPVTEPLYCVRFNSKEHIEEQNIQPGLLVYSAPQTEHSNFVFLKHLMMMKGSDASWKKDIEVPSFQVDFSDDEEEAQVKKGSNSNKSVTPKDSDEPMPKAFKPDHTQAASIHQPNAHGYPGGPRGITHERFRPRNPWGWSGPRNNTPNHSNQQNQFRSRGYVRPSSFNVDSSFQAGAPNRSSDSNEYPYPNNPQFGMERDPGMFSQLPPTYTNYNSSWVSPSSYEHQGNGYAQSNEHMNFVPSQFSTEDLRYQAFQSEIARLMDAYNRGADSPMTVPPPPFAAPTPPYAFNPASQFGLRPSGSTQFGARPPGTPPQFSARPPGPPPQFNARRPGLPPQFGARPPNHPPYLRGNHSNDHYYPS